MNTTALLGSAALFLGTIGQPVSPPKPAPSQPIEPAKVGAFNFDKDAQGGLPEGWKADGTNQEGPVAMWQVAEDKTAPSGPNVLALAKINHDSGGTFNICWTDKARFKDGSIAVKFKAVSGEEDQGGGLIWRVQDRDNYMIARMNPLEDNFRVYYVKDGSRKQIESANVTIQAGEWHAMRIEQHGDHVVCFLDGERCLDSRDDHIRAEGGVGLWTKADAVSSFDDLTINPGAADDADTGAEKKEKGKKDKDDDDDDEK